MHRAEASKMQHCPLTLLCSIASCAALPLMFGVHEKSYLGLRIEASCLIAPAKRTCSSEDCFSQLQNKLACWRKNDWLPSMSYVDCSVGNCSCSLIHSHLFLPCKQQVKQNAIHRKLPLMPSQTFGPSILVLQTLVDIGFPSSVGYILSLSLHARD